VYYDEFQVYLDYLGIKYLSNTPILLDSRAIYSFFIIVKWLDMIHSLILNPSTKDITILFEDTFISTNSSYKDILSGIANIT